MNIPSIAAASGLQQAVVRQQIDIAVLAKANNVAKTQQQAVLELLNGLNKAAQPAGGAGISGNGRKLNLLA